MRHILEIDISGIDSFAKNKYREESLVGAMDAFDTLIARDGQGEDLLGWVDFPSKVVAEELHDYTEIVDRWIGSKVEIVVIVGIGGSYIGSKAIYDALSPYFRHHESSREYPELIFAGQNLSGEYLAELKELLRDKKFAIIYISKSGTTIETSIAFRILKNLAEDIYGKESSKDKIAVVTGEPYHPFRDYAASQGYRIFNIPDNIGGRFSVLTAVGMLPSAIAGFNIVELLNGAAAMERICKERSCDNPALIYASIRNLLYKEGYSTEIFASYSPRLKSFAGWWAQLFGESEGKNGKGILPTPLNYTEDMHGLGQYIQQGRRIIFETILSIENIERDIKIVSDPGNPDGFEFLAGRNIDECNSVAEMGIRKAHIDGGVPNVRIVIPELNEFTIGALFYFFEFSCGISGYMLGVNPFDQPGVEDYKQNMFALLGKPGF